jgi:hypothetical protein
MTVQPNKTDPRIVSPAATSLALSVNILGLPTTSRIYKKCSASRHRPRADALAEWVMLDRLIAVDGTVGVPARRFALRPLLRGSRIIHVSIKQRL